MLFGLGPAASTEISLKLGCSSWIFWFIFLCLFLVLMDLLGVACGRLRSFAIFGLYGMFGVHGTSGGFLVFGVAWGCRGCVRFLGLFLVSWASLGGLGLLRLDL